MTACPHGVDIGAVCTWCMSRTTGGAAMNSCTKHAHQIGGLRITCSAESARREGYDQAIADVCAELDDVCACTFGQGSMAAVAQRLLQELKAKFGRKDGAG